MNFPIHYRQGSELDVKWQIMDELKQQAKDMGSDVTFQLYYRMFKTSVDGLWAIVFKGPWEGEEFEAILVKLGLHSGRELLIGTAKSMSVTNLQIVSKLVGTPDLIKPITKPINNHLTVIK